MRFLRRLRSLHVLAAFMLLLSTAAPALARMTCLSGGHTVVNVGQARTCCPDEAGPAAPQVKAACCEVVQVGPQRSAFVAGAPVEIALPLAVLPCATGEGAFMAQERGHVWDRSARPPTLLARRLASIGLFRI